MSAVQRTPPQEALRQLQYGMEEEGIPWEAAAGTGDALSHAWEAPGAPSWRWGIGLDRPGAGSPLLKLEREQPPVPYSTNSRYGDGAGAGGPMRRG